MRIIGVEFGTWSLKAVEIESRFRKIDILDFHEIRLPLQLEDPSATYRQAMTQLMARLPSHPEKIVTSIPAAQTALRFLPIPIKQRKQVEKTFRFELEDSVPFKLEDAIIEHHVSRTKEGSLVFAAIAPKKFVGQHVAWLKSIGVDPDWLTFEGMGLINLYLSQFIDRNKDEAPPDGPTLLLDIGHLKTNLAIFSQDQLHFFRSVAWGGANLTTAIAQGLGVSLEEAEKYKMNDLKLDADPSSATGETKELLNSAFEGLSPFITDIHHSLVTYRNIYHQEVGSLLLSGGTSKTWGIENYFKKTLGVTCRFFHPFQGMALKEELKDADEYRFAEPLGRALVFARKAGLLFNFRQQEIGKETSLTEVTTFLKDPNMVRLLQFAGALAMVLFIHVFIAGFLAEKERKNALEELRKAFSQTFPSIPSKLKLSLTSNPKDLKKFVDQKNQELDQKIKMVSKARVPMLSLVRTVSESFPPDIKVDVNTLQLDDRSLQMEGVLYAGNIDLVTEALKKVPSLNNVALERDGQRFTYRADVVGR